MEPRESEDIRDHLGRTPEEQWRDHELSRRRRLRETGQRPPGVNLAEGLAFSDWMCSFAGAAARAAKASRR